MHARTYRATMVNAQVKAGDTVLVTGAGGGVALTALQLCVAAGARVYVTSGSADKVARAVALGARGGVLYKDGASHTPPPPRRTRLIRAGGANSGLAGAAGRADEERRSEAPKRGRRLWRGRHRIQDFAAAQARRTHRHIRDVRLSLRSLSCPASNLLLSSLAASAPPVHATRAGTRTRRCR